MDIHDIRRQNLQKILTVRFQGYRAGLAAALDRQASYISRCLTTIEKNRKRIGEDFARHIESKLELPPGSLDSPDGVKLDDKGHSTDLKTLEKGPEFSRPFKRASILGTAQLGPDGYWEALSLADGWIDVPSSDPGAYSLRVKGDSMAPAIRSGWVVWCEPNHRLVPGEYVMVRRSNGECMVKELLYENDDEVSLMAVNDGYGRLSIDRKEIEQIHYVGGIVPPSKINY